MIRRGRLLALAVVVLGAGAGAADAPETSVRPQARAEPAQQTPVDALGQVLTDLLRPAMRPLSGQEAAPAAVADGGPALSQRPRLRPSWLAERVQTRQAQRRKGMVCGDPDLQGEVVGRVSGKLPGCGTNDGVRLKSVSGIPLSQAALIDCDTARAFKTWVEKGMKPAMRPLGRVTRIRVAAHYACRTRNNQPGARISEHGKAKAIDVSAFHLANGEVVTVLEGWKKRRTSGPLRQMHKAACGPFGTVLGPNSDRFHRDHFHFDTARYRSGPYCR